MRITRTGIVARLTPWKGVTGAMFIAELSMAPATDSVPKTGLSNLGLTRHESHRMVVMRIRPASADVAVFSPQSDPSGNSAKEVVSKARLGHLISEIQADLCLNRSPGTI